jgi:kynurenine 3-monooxygenase
MPNEDKTFTCNLFMPFKGKISFEALENDEDFVRFMHQTFPELAAEMPLLEETIRTGPKSTIWDIKCYPWTFDKVCLIGDAAHAVVPFYG